jgi:deazaflavin-dependent oxidoreductase (nitroreductase family)
MSYAEANALHRSIRRLAATRPGSWFLARTLHHADRVVYRLSRRQTTLASQLSGLPVVMLTTTGARSGRETTVPVLGFEEGEAVVLVASNYGQAHHPAWYHNLRAHPRARVAVRGQWREMGPRRSPARSGSASSPSPLWPTGLQALRGAGGPAPDRRVQTDTRLTTRPGTQSLNRLAFSGGRVRARTSTAAG